HELTHVVQQGREVSRKVYRNTGSPGTSSSASSSGGAISPPADVTPIEPTPAGGPYEFTKDGKRFKYCATTSPKELHLPEVRIPNFKQRHQSLHETPLIRPNGER